MPEQSISLQRCTGGGYIIRAATGKKEDFTLSTAREEKKAEEKLAENK